MSLTSESIRRSVVLSSFHRRHLTPVGQLGLSSLPPQFRPMPETQARTLVESEKVDGDPQVRAARRSASCGFQDGAAGKSVVCSFFDHGPPDELAQANSVADRPRIEDHSSIAEFDSDALITTVTAKLTMSGVSDQLWRMLATGSDPQSWSKVAPDYFKVSSREGKGPPIGQGWKGRLHEVFEWNWNPDTSARYENMLGIDFQIKKDTVQVDYWLEACLTSDFGLGSQPGGLDLDGGTLLLTRDGTTVTSVATKSLRYTDPPDAPDGLVLMLSYLTPATLGLWLDAAVYNGSLETIEAYEKQLPTDGKGAGTGRNPVSPIPQPPVTVYNPDTNHQEKRP